MAIMMATVARNEGAYIAEWFAFHLLRGVDTILLFDNESDDDTVAIARRYAVHHDVRIIHWPTPQGAHFPSFQEAAYTRAHAIALQERMDWLLFSDVDEFTFGEGDTTLAERLALLPADVGAVAVKPYDFGSNFRRDRPSRGLVIGNFLRSVNDEFAKTPGFVKSFARPQMTLGMRDTPHAVLLMQNARYVYPDGTAVEHDEKRFGLVTNPSLGGIVQHHYITKSWEEFIFKRNRYVGKSRKIDDSFFINREQVCNAVERPTLAPWVAKVQAFMDTIP